MICTYLGIKEDVGTLRAVSCDDVEYHVSEKYFSRTPLLRTLTLLLSITLASITLFSFYSTGRGCG